MKFNALIPELSVRDISVSRKFYTELLGFICLYERPEGKFCFLSLENAQMMLEEINNCWATGTLDYPLGRGINFQISLQNIMPQYGRLNNAQIPLFRELAIHEYLMNETLYREQEFLVQDPDGYLWRFSMDA